MEKVNERYKKLTLLHSNDMHGDFLAENVDDKLVGGVSMLSGYISKVKQEEKNVLYCVAGDMFRGSIIDSEYKGVSTVEIMNMLAPDVVTLGNHETDYGLSHLLFIEKCAKFPIINSNLFIKMNGARLFNPYRIIEIDGMKILFIGIITEEVMASAKRESVIGTLVDINDATEEIAKICNTFKGIDIDFTVLLTHIGFEKDKKLAAALDPALGIDVIIGGHSHTYIDKPEKVNDILIVQAGTGTDQIGRFDIVVDTDNNCVDSYKWQAVPINSSTCPRDEKMEKLVGELKSETDLKYGRVLRRLNCPLKHESRYRQTELGSFIADIMQKTLKVDIGLMTSGAIRDPELGPIVTMNDIMACCPYKDTIYEVKVTGKQLLEIFNHYLKQYSEQEGEYYQFSSGIYVEYDSSIKAVSKIEYNGLPLDEEKVYSIAVRGYDFSNFEEFFGVKLLEAEQNGKARMVCSNMLDLLIEYLGSSEELPIYPDKDRLKVK